MKNLKKYFKGFTLVELIIVITILAILATIAFVSFQNYTRDARDANRTATIKNIEKWLELFTIKTGNFPVPDESTPFTGGLDGKVKINQWIVWDGVATIINMNTTPLDPNDKSKYTYSTFWDDNKYYQVAINAENYQTSFISQTYAFTPKSAIVKWNYRFDPSLPSLIVVPSSVNTASWIFDPKVCFVIDGWQNSLSSSSGSCIEKEEMSLKEFDNSLVGYWDMETTSWALLKDLSGNGNYWTWSWLILPTGTWWHLWKWYYFSWWYFTFNSDKLDIENDITIWVITKNYSYNILWASSFLSRKWNYNLHILGGYYRFWDNNSNWLQSNILINTDFHYFSWKWEKSSNKISLYLDGNKITENTPDNSWSILKTSNSGSLTFIWNNPNAPQLFNWIIDDVKIYNRALSDEEIRQQAKIAGF